MPHLLVLTAEHPYRERLWALLMVALYRGSRQADALAAYQRARHTLMENLGLLPGPELRGIEEAILGGRPDPFARFAPAEAVGTAPVHDGLGGVPAASYGATPEPGRPHLTLVDSAPLTAPAPRTATRGPWADGAARLAR